MRFVAAAAIGSVALATASAASAHENAYYWTKGQANEFFDTNPLRPYGTYDGLTIRVYLTKCRGYVRRGGSFAVHWG